MLSTQHPLLRGIVLRPGERIEGVVRQHASALIPATFLATIVIGADLFFMVPLFGWGTAGVSVFVALFLTAACAYARAYYLWARTALVITNHRVIDIFRQGIFKKVVSEIPYAKIGDVSFRVKGVWQSIFHLGTVNIESAQSQATMVLYIEHVRRPEEVTRRLADVIAEFDPSALRRREESDEDRQLSKEQAKEEFLDGWDDDDYEESLQKYEEYDPARLGQLYEHTFGELEYAKLLVDELIAGGVAPEVIAKQARKREKR